MNPERGDICCACSSLIIITCRINISKCIIVSRHKNKNSEECNTYLLELESALP
jgi:hypothetical protein